MSSEILQTVSNILIALGLVLAALGGYGAYHFSKKLETEREVLARNRENELASKMESMLEGNQALQKRIEPFAALATRRFPQMETEAALEKLAEEVTLQRRQLETIRRYTEVSKLNYIGTTGTAGRGLRENTPISRMLEGAYTVEDNRARYSCDSLATAKFRDIAKTYPDFPFAYYALALCAKQGGDDSWKSDAEKAVEILKHTTTIDGHHPNHDQALQELTRVIQEGENRER